jgi:hypothetical protein
MDVGNAPFGLKDIPWAKAQEVMDVSDLHSLGAGEHEVLVRISQYALDISLESLVFLGRTKELGLCIRVDRLDLREEAECGTHVIAACRAQLKARSCHCVLRS